MKPQTEAARNMNYTQLDAEAILAGIKKAVDTQGVSVVALDGLLALFVSMNERITRENIPIQLRRIADKMDADAGAAKLGGS